MKNPYKTLSKKIMYKSEFLTVREDQILNGNKKGIYSVIFRNGKGGISVIAKDKKGDFYLVKQWRYPINKEAIEFVAGKIDKNETPLQAAKRELFEETGLTSGDGKVISIQNNLTINNNKIFKLLYIYIYNVHVHITTTSLYVI
jgi:8-oxo-dGTP pyrophosphatase MutT (NUDIX family)